VNLHKLCAIAAVMVVGCTGEIVSPSNGPSSSSDGGIAPPHIDAAPWDPDASPAPDATVVPESFCGDDSCDVSEDCASCASDCGQCPPDCGDGICGGAETCSTCQPDCGMCDSVCGDAICNGVGGAEMCTTCEADCNTSAAVCGNGECQAGETSLTCRADCGPAVWPLEWASFEDEVVVLINAERAAGTDCPNGEKDPTGPVSMTESLRTATRLHSWDMSWESYFDHTSCNGRSPWVRAAAAGASATGETIGGGYPTPAAMVDGWMNSSGHCNILMNPGNTLVGVGYANEGGGKWTALFR
jgi:uncharacterized protein YkwD